MGDNEKDARKPQISSEDLTLCDDIQRDRYYIDRYRATYPAKPRKIHSWDTPER